MHKISRKEAIKTGQTKYWTGKTCSKGHVSWRYVAGCHCAQCMKDKNIARMGFARKYTDGKSDGLSKSELARIEKELNGY